MDKNQYNNAKIYTLRCKDDDSLIYVGSTIQPLCKRLVGHKTASILRPNTLIYKTINNDWSNWYIELYEEYPCNNKEQLNKREGEVIRQIGTLNKNISGRTPKEYYNENIAEITEKRKQYYKSNVDRIIERQHIYDIKNAEKINERMRNYFRKKRDSIKNENVAEITD